MLLYTTVGTNDLPRAIAFYDAIFTVLKQPRLPDWAEGWAAWGKEYDEGFCFCLCSAFDGRPATAGNGTMFAFRAEGAAQVRQFHAAGIRHGGQDEGAPGVRALYGPDFYVAYLRDPDGNKLACVYHNFDPATEAQGGVRADL